MSDKQLSTTSASTPRVLTEAEASQFLRCSQDLLKKWRIYGIGPQYFRLGGRAIRYRSDWLESYMQSQVGGAA
jgi:hypothetical protein